MRGRDVGVSRRVGRANGEEGGRGAQSRCGNRRAGKTVVGYLDLHRAGRQIGRSQEIDLVWD